MSNFQSMTRKQAEAVIRTAGLCELAELACHPCNQVAKRAKFLLARHAENVAKAREDRNRRLVGQAQNLGRVMRLAQPKSIAQAQRDWGLTYGQVKTGLSAWGDSARQIPMEIPE